MRLQILKLNYNHQIALNWLNDFERSGQIDWFDV